MDNLLIHITTYNRKEITKLCLENMNQVNKYKCPIHINDDSSTEYDSKWLKKYANKVTTTANIGIEYAMRKILLDFKYSKFEFLYETDNDTLHDPEFLDVALDLYNRTELPITLYNSKAHDVFIVDKVNNIYIKSSFPGCSLLIHKNHIKDIPDNKILDVGMKHWDWHLIELMKTMYICPEMSYCDHYMEGGIHSENGNDEKGENVTLYLYEKRLKYMGLI